ncbi:MAG: thiol reductase thioredoxin [Bacteroidetes bacterium]|nr:thiol reductase thioredoxin [Bacteroidota bacterium]
MLTLTDYYADWCEPCKWLEPILEELKKHFGDRIIIQKVNIDENAADAAALHILSVPTLILRRDGKEIWRKRGFDIAPKMINEIESSLS